MLLAKSLLRGACPNMGSGDYQSEVRPGLELSVDGSQQTVSIGSGCRPLGLNVELPRAETEAIEGHALMLRGKGSSLMKLMSLV